MKPTSSSSTCAGYAQTWEARKPQHPHSMQQISGCRPGLALLILCSYCAHTDLPMTSYPACTTTSTSRVSSLTQFHTLLPLLSIPPLCIYRDRGLRAIQNRQSSYTWLSGSTVMSLGRLLHYLWFNTLIFPFDILIYFDPRRLKYILSTIYFCHLYCRPGEPKRLG